MRAANYCKPRADRVKATDLITEQRKILQLTLKMELGYSEFNRKLHREQYINVFDDLADHIINEVVDFEKIYLWSWCGRSFCEH